MAAQTSRPWDHTKLLFVYGAVIALALVAPPVFAQTLSNIGSADAADPCPLPQARTFVEKGNYPAAEQSMRLCILRDKGAVDAHYLLAYVLMRENRARDSLGEYTLAASLRTPAAEDLKNVALDYVLLNDYLDAEKWMLAALAKDPNNSDAVYSLGRIRYTQGHYPEARDLFLKALNLSPHGSKAANNLGLCYEALGRPDDAITAYRQAIEWQQQNTRPSEQPLLNLATILITRNQSDEALALLLRATQIAPDNEKVHEQLGHLYLLKGELPSAQSELERALTILPSSAALHFQLAQVYRKQGNLSGSRSESARAAQLNGTRSSPTSN